MSKYLDDNGLLYFWQKIKNLFTVKSDSIKNITRSGTTFTATRADGTSFTFTQQDNTVAKTTTTPKENGTAAVGSETKYAAGDHVHPHDSTKVDKVTGKGLSTNDYTTDDKNSLEFIESVSIDGLSIASMLVDDGSEPDAHDPRTAHHFYEVPEDDAGTNGTYNITIPNLVVGTGAWIGVKFTIAPDFDSTHPLKFNVNGNGAVRVTLAGTNVTNDYFTPTSGNTVTVNSYQLYVYRAGTNPSWDLVASSSNDFTTAEKDKLAGIAEGAQKNTITGVKGNAESSYRTGNVNITPTNIGLGNLTNDKQVKGLASGTTNGHLVVWGADGYTVKDGGAVPASITVDSALSSTSTNPVQNKVINSKITELSGTISDVSIKTDDVYDVNIDGVDLGSVISSGEYWVSHYAECSTPAATVAKTVKCSGFKLLKGSMIFVRFTVTNTGAVGSLTLSVNGTTAAGIKYRNANISAAGVLAANRIYCFVYDGTYWQIVGDLDTNTTYSNMAQSEATTGTATAARLISAKVLNDTIDAKITAAQAGAATYKGSATKEADISGTAYKAGWYWVVGTAGTYFGETCEVGDMIFANANKGTSAQNSDFDVIQANIVTITNAEIDTIVAS